ncbi:hypothetical protein WOSG25_190180 [Weissella oryzae SG25]|uniref:Polymerase beta nucleotidyltransferase domain-containing protein n=1 Tax=Weissella oryzae (strain DSM 25784 / JCM 18191 / LMG 30913 / SG25) TaxID=1329250 RepID=A0A069CVU3_WEIOS|nr:nucleotidyltransferase domain-containing protein [Weissella oryzae]GAK31910.1 hypothetical protein WOSG25_190180 [Weissella oryzae SG25]
MLLNLPTEKLSLNEIKQRVKSIFSQYDIKKAYIYGSYVNGNFDFTSDYDLLLDGFYGKGQPFIGHKASLRELQRKLEKALNREVDIILLSNLMSPSTNKLDEEFKQNVKRDMVLIYGE